jgi:phthiocerol/phenolphthiocerol synthesis type-I polyketide synthase E
MNSSGLTSTDSGIEIAIIGMSGAFPGARDLEQFWNQIRNGVESLSQFNEQELMEAGVSPQLIQDPNYIRSGGFLPEAEFFDAPFFRMTPREGNIAYSLNEFGKPWKWQGTIHRPRKDLSDSLLVRE